jgi:hypothetical protein
VGEAAGTWRHDANILRWPWVWWRWAGERILLVEHDPRNMDFPVVNPSVVGRPSRQAWLQAQSMESSRWLGHLPSRRA